MSTQHAFHMADYYRSLATANRFSHPDYYAYHAKARFWRITSGEPLRIIDGEMKLARWPVERADKPGASEARVDGMPSPA
jgi:hypothetical protein